MKILHIITRLIVGGAQENTLLTCEGLAHRGHAVTLAHGPIYGPEGSLARRAADGPTRTVELPSLLRPVHPLRDALAYRECRALIRRERPDVVHTHSSKAGIIGRAAAWAEDVPAVHTIHGLPFHDRQNRLVRAAYTAAERWASRRCRRLVSVADAMGAEARRAGIGTDAQHTTVYSGMDLAPFLEGPDDREVTRSALGLHPTDLVVGTVARLAPLKGHDDLLDALSPLLREETRLKLLWVGDGPWRRRLTRRVERLALTDRVVMTGLADPGRIPSLLRAMDLLVHPSYREGLPRAVPQALLSGVPVVSYDVGGAGEVCRDGETGSLVPMGDTRTLARAVRRMVDDAEHRAATAQAGRELCRHRFAAETMVDALERHYREILS